MPCFRVARSDKKQRRGGEQKPEWHGGLKPPHFGEEATEGSSALQLCDAVAEIGDRYEIDWDSIERGGGDTVMLEPFQTQLGR